MMNDQAEINKRPKLIIAVSIVIITWKLLAGIVGIPQSIYGLGQSPIIAFISAFFPFKITYIVLAIFLLRRKNWARIILLVLIPLMTLLDTVIAANRIGIEAIYDRLPVYFIIVFVIGVLASNATRKWFTEEKDPSTIPELSPEERARSAPRLLELRMRSFVCGVRPIRFI